MSDLRFGRCYLWSEEQGKVVEFSVPESSPSRPSSRAASPMKPRKLSALSRASSINNLDTCEEDDKDRKIRELEDTLRKQKELMEILQNKLEASVENQVLPLHFTGSFITNFFRIWRINK